MHCKLERSLAFLSLAHLYLDMSNYSSLTNLLSWNSYANSGKLCFTYGVFHDNK